MFLISSQEILFPSMQICTILKGYIQGMESNIPLHNMRVFFRTLISNTQFSAPNIRLIPRLVRFC